VIGSPFAEPAQPRALVGGHLISTATGLAMMIAFGGSIWIAAAAVGVAIALMLRTRTFHPPAGIDPLIIVIAQPAWHFLLVPVAAGAILLALFAYVWHNATERGAWLARWW
jgi:CBS-domain-containing membrane protein